MLQEIEFIRRGKTVHVPARLLQHVPCTEARFQPIRAFQDPDPDPEKPCVTVSHSQHPLP